jgi:hypothetical protein
VLGGNGSYTFTPADGFIGDVPVVTYTVVDGDNNEDLSTLTITVEAPSDLADADESVSTDVDTAVSGDVLLNGSSSDGPLSVTTFTVDGQNYTAGDTATLTEGTLVLGGNGSYTFTPADGFIGDVPVVTYIVEDGAGDTNESTLTIVVTPAENIPPVAEDDAFSIYQGESVSGNIISHDDGDGVIDYDGGDGSVLSVTQINGSNLVFGSDGFATVSVEGGTVTINAAGTFTYNNSEGYVLGTDHYPSFEYTLTDGTDIDTATVTITIDDSAPVAVDDYNYVNFSDLSEYGRSDITDSSSVIGNVITGGTSNDHIDTSDDGPVKLIKFNYDGSDFVFSDQITSYTVSTPFGEFTMDDTGDYSFSLPRMTNVSDIPDYFNIVYTVEDSDDFNPETGDATLTIEFIHANQVVSSLKTASEDDLIDIPDTDDIQGDKVTQKSINYDLGELLVEGNNESLDEYLQFDGLVVNSVLENDAQISEVELILEAETQNINKESGTEVVITNSLLKEGATLISDASPENVPQQIELDSSDQI